MQESSNLAAKAIEREEATKAELSEELARVRGREAELEVRLQRMYLRHKCVQTMYTYEYHKYPLLSFFS